MGGDPKKPTIRTLISLDFITTLASSVWIAAIIYVYVEQNLKLGEQWWGYINTSYFIGMIVSGLLVIRFAKLLERYICFFIVFGLFLSALLTMLFGANTNPAIAFFASMYVRPPRTNSGCILHQAYPRSSIGKNISENICGLGSCYQSYVCKFRSASRLYNGNIRCQYNFPILFNFNIHCLSLCDLEKEGLSRERNIKSSLQAFLSV